MHPCLEIDELFTAIAKEVRFGSHIKKPGRVNVFSLVKTCRAFKDPALGVLWSLITTPMPLLNLLPNDLREIKAMEFEGREVETLTFKRAAIPSDWERFDHYAQLVIKFGDTGPPARFVNIDPKVLQILAGRGKVLLPNMQKIVLTSRGMLQIAPILLSPRVEVCSTEAPWEDLRDLGSALFKSIALNSPHLKTFRAYLPGDPGPSEEELQRHVMPQLSQIVLKLPYLEKFHSNWIESQIEDDAIRHLMVLPTMRDLGTFLSSYSAVNNPKPPMGTARCALKYLGVMCYDLAASGLITLLEETMPVNLCTLSVISLRRCTPTSDLQRLFQLLNIICSSNDFSSLFIHEYNQDDPNYDFTITLPVLQPLLKFCNITALDLQAHPLNATDSDLLVIASSFPRLEKLRFGFLKHLDDHLITFQGLLHIAEHCRSMTVLGLSFRADFPAGDLFPCTENCKHENLKLLEVGYSKVGDADKTSTFIRTLFPRLKGIDRDMFPVGNDPNRKEWDEVRNLLGIKSYEFELY
ncbi:hypothetical protein BDQ12DRAFT_715225 [Crucibulum laeve]|uniref:F-box domain-containing protein n=1 Tax=Crucibulum laeve TaxID=68775 RepID=A0A5C3LPM7_9AGAR|nr:hypothetical protein BDQ12DRAFT_715225 [Crucibulum laeve]